MAQSRIFSLATLLLSVFFLSDSYARNIVVSLRAANGQFLMAEGGGGSNLRASANAVQTWERFLIVDVNGGKLNSGDEVILKTLNGHYVTSDRNQNMVLFANRKEAREWERFSIIRVGGSGEINHGDTIALQLRNIPNTLYVTAENAGGRELRARSAAIYEWEKFKLSVLSETPERLKLSAPFASPNMFMKPIGYDHDRNDGRNDGDCRNYYGITFPGCYDNHEGVDFMLWGHWPSQDLGFDVVAAAPGIVVMRADGFTDRCHFDPREDDNIFCPGTENEDANYVGIRQDDGHIVYYYHLRKNSVAVNIGDRVECGQKLGQVGSSGRSSAPHLHFQVHKPLSRFDEAVTIDYSTSNIASKAAYLDPYRENMWGELRHEIPRKTCGNPNPDFGPPPAPPRVPLCLREQRKVECNNSAQWTVCAPAINDLGRVCLVRAPTRCQTSCADVCRVVTETVMLPCNPF